MGQIFNRLERLIRSMSQDTGGWDDIYGEDLSDADMRDAWEELNRFLDDDDLPKAGGSRGAEHASSVRHPPESLRRHFETLGVPFGADYAAVKKAYRDQLRLYHPDMHAGDPVKQQEATHITQKIIIAFRHIRSYYETGAA